ncbi:hypothetical protein ACQ3I4_09415 [Zafaria sp. Z1313]|uniref:hypothetical protein n=1 Tax=Zafaria sp. Z1313 TaxID=3423202 RepID=UPI003D302D03
MQELAAAAGPGLELLGWIALAAALAFFAASAVHRLLLRQWQSAPYVLMVLEGQRCAVWTTPEGGMVSHALADAVQERGTDPGRAGDASEHGGVMEAGSPSETGGTVYYQQHQDGRWQFTPPEDHSRLLRGAGWILFALFALTQLLGLAAAV